jgi:hypothetical protein
MAAYPLASRDPEAYHQLLDEVGDWQQQSRHHSQLTPIGVMGLLSAETSRLAGVPWTPWMAEVIEGHIPVAHSRAERKSDI